jgi:hypothetical protein
MKQQLYRIEVSPSRSQGWPWFVRLAKRFRSYKVARDEDLEVHSIETRSVGDLCAVYELVRSWKGWAFYVNDRPAPRADLARIFLKWSLERSQDPLGDYPPAPRERPDLPF